MHGLHKSNVINKWSWGNCHSKKVIENCFIARGGTRCVCIRTVSERQIAGRPCSLRKSGKWCRVNGCRGSCEIAWPTWRNRVGTIRKASLVSSSLWGLEQGPGVGLERVTENYVYFGLRLRPNRFERLSKISLCTRHVRGTWECREVRARSPSTNYHSHAHNRNRVVLNKHMSQISKTGVVPLDERH